MNIEEKLQNYSISNHVRKLNIPQEAIPLIVGKKGVTIQELRSDTGVRRIDIDSSSSAITIRGR